MSLAPLSLYIEFLYDGHYSSIQLLIPVTKTELTKHWLDVLVYRLYIHQKIWKLKCTNA